MTIRVLSQDVAGDTGVRFQGLDLRYGYNLLTVSLVNTISEPAHTIFCPPYHDMVKYSGTADKGM